MIESRYVSTPRRFWIVGVAALVWNLIGAMDYVMTQAKSEAYMSWFTPEQLEFFYSFPAWLVSGWAVAVWGSVLGSVLLLMRRKFAVNVFVISFSFMVLMVAHKYGYVDGAITVGVGGFLLSIVIFAVSLALVIYSRFMFIKGVLVWRWAFASFDL